MWGDFREICGLGIGQPLACQPNTCEAKHQPASDAIQVEGIVSSNPGFSASIRELTKKSHRYRKQGAYNQIAVGCDNRSAIIAVRLSQPIVTTPVKIGCDYRSAIIAVRLSHSIIADCTRSIRYCKQPPTTVRARRSA
ncbi:hypothetical protein Ddc_24684 [Ditylenchus destructor]|nr:hypothetical protein Ddc_24684 [Ditylenchus destructor]